MLNGKFKVVDAHCHIYPDKIAERATAGTDSFYGEHSVCKGTVSDLITRGQATGIDMFIVQSVATTPKQVHSINEFIAHEVDANKDILVGLGTLHPESTDIKSDIDHIIELGLHGIKLHPDIQQFETDCSGYMKIYEVCEEKRLPILIHAGDHRYDYSNPNRLSKVLKAFPDLTFVAAHLGGWSVWEDALKLLPGTENLYVDCSSCFPFISDTGYVYKMIRTYGSDKVLFGTDYPMWSVDKEIERFMSLDFSDKEKEMMLYTNAAKIFDI